jgi:hypothetical protein
MTPDERAKLIRQYADGPAVLKAALSRVPGQVMKWRPAPTKWSVHEILCHCADSEMNAALRIRYLAAEPSPRIIGYDQDVWTRTFDYHALDDTLALELTEGVRKWTVPVLERLSDAQWLKEGTHSERGRFTAEDWLSGYAEHLHAHARQIDRNLAAWKARPSGGSATGSIVA